MCFPYLGVEGLPQSFGDYRPNHGTLSQVLTICVVRLCVCLCLHSHACLQTYMHAHFTRVYMCMMLCAYIQHMHIIYAYTHTCTHACIFSYNMHTFKRANELTYEQKYIRTQKFIYTSCHGLMIALITWNSNFVLEGLCTSNPFRCEFSVFWGFAGIAPTTSGLTVPRSDQRRTNTICF